MSLDIRIRVATNDDMPFIVDSWLSTYWGSDVGRALNRIGREPALQRYLPIIEFGAEKPSLYYGLQRKLVTGLLARCGAIVACDPGAESVIYGWLCGDETGDVPLLHYVCVKAGFQERGIAGRLMTEAGISSRGLPAHYTHSTDDFLSNVFSRNTSQGLVYRPELARV
jgi:hypothetical protein